MNTITVAVSFVVILLLLGLIKQQLTILKEETYPYVDITDWGNAVLYGVFISYGEGAEGLEKALKERGFILLPPDPNIRGSI